MIYDYFSISKSAELKLRKKRSMETRVSKRTLKIHAAARLKRYEELMTVEQIVQNLVNDCVDSVCETVSSYDKQRKLKGEIKKEVKGEIKKQVKKELVGSTKPFKRRRG